MRRFVCGLLLAGIASPVLADDFDLSWLRGSAQPVADPPKYARWSGFYGGGVLGADFHGVTFANDGNTTLSTIRSSDAIVGAVPMGTLPGLANANVASPSFGGFFGYNYQIDDIVLGVEAMFNQTSATASSSQTQYATQSQLNAGSVTLDGFSTPTTVSQTRYTPTSVYESNAASARLLDYGTVRIRGGWAFDSFLPYVMVGVSVARVELTQVTAINYHGTSLSSFTNTAVTPNVTTFSANPNVNVAYAVNQSTSGRYFFGFSAGLGLDYELTRHIFLRGEVEYIQLGTPANMTMNTASARAGAGVKF
jgi:outer membrane immunogenic protein